ncbi:hypothetical protein AAMO2058_001234100 [Amorphochlora amoebiformis]
MGHTRRALRLGRATARFLSRSFHENLTNRKGRIEVIMGPMFAGKTSTLLRRVKEEEREGRSVLVVKSAKDKRYATDAVVTHDGEKRGCAAVERLDHLPEDLLEDIDVVAVDESQFFSDLLETCVKIAESGKLVITAGLDMDFRGKAFGETSELARVADTSTKLKAICTVCGDPASYTTRLIKDPTQTVVGGAEIYAPVCSTHFELTVEPDMDTIKDTVRD